MPNALYATTGVHSERQTDGTGMTSMTVTDRISHAGGLRIAALGLAAEHGAASFAFAQVMALPVQIAVSQREVRTGDALTLRSRLRHQGRNMLLTDMEAFRNGDFSHQVGFGTILWSVTGPAPENRPPRRPLSDWPGTERDMLDIAGIGAQGGVLHIATIAPEVAGPGGILHAGALQVLMEEAVLTLVAQSGLDRAAIHVADAAFHFVRAARDGAFVARPRQLHRGTGRCEVEAEIVDRNGDGRLCALCHATIQVNDQ